MRCHKGHSNNFSNFFYEYTPLKKQFDSYCMSVMYTLKSASTGVGFNFVLLNETPYQIHHVDAKEKTDVSRLKRRVSGIDEVDIDGRKICEFQAN